MQVTMRRRKQSLVHVSWTLPHAYSIKSSAVNHLANLKPAALPEYTHRSSERKPTSAPPKCCWGQFHHRCCCCTSGTPPSYTSRWSTTAGLNGSKLRKLPGTYEEGKEVRFSHQAAKVGVIYYWTENNRGDVLAWLSKRSAHAPAFLLKKMRCKDLELSPPSPTSLLFEELSWVLDSTFLALLYEVPCKWNNKTLL